MTLSFPETLTAIVRRGGRVTVLTGAGISAESGIQLVSTLAGRAIIRVPVFLNLQRRSSILWQTQKNRKPFSNACLASSRKKPATGGPGRAG